MVIISALVHYPCSTVTEIKLLFNNKCNCQLKSAIKLIAPPSQITTPNNYIIFSHIKITQGTFRTYSGYMQKKLNNFGILIFFITYVAFYNLMFKKYCSLETTS